MIMYFALIVDLVKSRKMNDDDRFDAQKKLNNAVKVINGLVIENVVKPLSFSAGDSIQGLFDNAQAAFSAYSFVENLIFPYSIRCGIGCGSINEKIINKFNTDDSNVYDGKAYHLARNAMDMAKEYTYKIFIDSELDIDKTLNILFNDDKLINMTPSQKAIYSLINIIDPIEYNHIIIGKNYYEEIAVSVKEITDHYREKSRVNRNPKFINHEVHDNNNQINQSEINTILAEHYKHYQLKDYEYILSNNKTTISSELRETLVRLIGSSYQNVSSMIRISHMDELRKRRISKLNILMYFYGGHIL